MDITENIKKIIENEKVSQADLARKAGIPAMSIYNIFSGQTKDPKFSVVIAIARALGRSMYDFVGYIDIPAEHMVFYEDIILTTEKEAENQHITLNYEKKTFVANALYRFAIRKMEETSKQELLLDMTYLQWLLRSSNSNEP